MANQSATEAGSNIASYAGSPALHGLIFWLYRVFATPEFLAASFFLLGSATTMLFRRRRNLRTGVTPTDRLATEISLAAFSLDGMSKFQMNPATIANLNVVLNKMRAQGFAMPPLGETDFAREKLSYYLHQVAAYLKAGDVASAKATAASQVNNWN